jgi:hypothetical protein
MMYARCTLVTVAWTQVLSVAKAWMTLGGDDEMSRRWMNEGDQKSAWGEFCERETFTSRIVLAVLLLSRDLGTAIRLIRDISSVVSCGRGDRPPAWISNCTAGASLFDCSLENKPAFLGLGVGAGGTVRPETVGVRAWS